MSWYRKEYESRFDQFPPDGLFFLDGNVIERQTKAFVWGMKSPMLTFPSGEVYPVWDEYRPQVQVLTTVDVPLSATRDQAYAQVMGIAHLGLTNLTAIELWGPDRLYLYAKLTDEGCLLVYDNEARRLLNVLTAAFRE
ncbi:MAG: hypothetical protein JNJ61_14915 [Anaerolineae bacterium]|nr:hypothetical protein [Anaerolineae bacterium]